jgi:tubulin polyglutamylase complex subunit 2
MAASKMTHEEIFYEHLTLGLFKVLSNHSIVVQINRANPPSLTDSIPRVTNVVYERRIACERTQVTAWEQRHNIYLPDDMKRFYLSTDGFHLYWSYKYSSE